MAMLSQTVAISMEQLSTLVIIVILPYKTQMDLPADRFVTIV